MAPPSDAHSATSSGDSAAAKPNLEQFLDKLDLNEEDFQDVEIDEDDPEINKSVRWLALARVHMDKNFSPSAFYKHMRATWNPAQSLQIHELPDPYCKRHIVEKLLKGAGEIMEMRLNGNTRGDYVRVRVNHDIQQPLMKFVSIVRAKERQVYLVRYEKMARFCKVCGLVGHEHKECGLGIHDEKKLKFGDWLYADTPNQTRPDVTPAKAATRPLGGAAPVVPVEPGHEKLDPEVLDTATSPVKNPGVVMEVDKDGRKRLNMDHVVSKQVITTGTPTQLLAITDGNGDDLGAGVSPSSSTSSSKRLKLASDTEKNEISAASLEEDRLMQ
ncbi:hypothetical protein VPH35_026482 [Triticum aestivum]